MHKIFAIIALIVLPAAISIGEELALTVNHQGMLTLSHIKAGDKTKLICINTLFSIGYFHEIENWKWQPVVTAEHDREGWPTSTPINMSGNGKFIYTGRISTCPYTLEITRPSPGKIQVDYSIDGQATQWATNEEKAFRHTAARGIVLKVPPETKGLKFNDKAKSVIADFESENVKVLIKLNEGSVKRYYTRSAEPYPGLYHAFDLGLADNTQLHISFMIELSPEIKVELDNRSFAQISDQRNWNIIKLDHRSLPLDVSSSVLDAPAGKYGFLTTRNGKFYFENKQESPAYFAGVTLVHDSKFPDKETAEDFAGQIAGMGCNLVRLHHLDYYVAGLGIFDRNEMKAGKTGNFDVELIDRMDYLMYVLKKRGIYIHLDGITARKFLPNDGVDGYDKLTFGLKGSAYLYENQVLMNKQIEYLNKLWNHVNPYTKLAYKNDPAIITAAVINENDMFLHGNPDHHFSSQAQETYRHMLAEWEKAHHETTERRQVDEFRRDLMKGYFERMIKTLKELNPLRPICGTTWINPERLQLLSTYTNTDFTADHPYCGGFISSDVLNLFDPHFRHFSNLTLAKRYDQPIMHEEWNSPGADRAGTMGLNMTLMTAFDHDATIIFALHHSFKRGVIRKDILGINIAYDPARLFMLPLFNLAFIRRDFKPNPVEYVYMLTDKILFGTGSESLLKKKFEEIYPSYSLAAFYGRASFAFNDNDLKKIKLHNPDAIIVTPQAPPCNLPKIQDYPLKNSTGEIEIYYKEAIVLGKSPRTKFAFGNWGKKGFVELGNDVAINVTNTKNAYAAISSLTNDPLDKTKKMELVILGKVELDGMYFDSDGNFPIAQSDIIVSEPITGTLRLAKTLTNLKVWERLPNNQRGNCISAKLIDTAWEIKLNPAVAVYEIESD